MSAAMTPEFIQSITTEYYSRFCTTDITSLRPGAYFFSSEERDRILPGFGCKYSIFIFVQRDLQITTFSPRYYSVIEASKSKRFDEYLAKLCSQFKLKVMDLLVFEEEKTAVYGSAKILTPDDYPLYERFFRSAYPHAKPEGWLREYYNEKTCKGLIAGYIKDGSLVSVCDAPDMPYMEGLIQHTGIMTLPEERRKGYAKCTAAMATHTLIQKRICPQWECDADNIASLMLAKSIGYREFAKAYILKEQD